MDQNDSQQARGLLAWLPRLTNRLRIRPFTELDASALYELHRDPIVTRFAGGTRSKEESLAVLQGIIQRSRPDGFAPLAVEERATEELIGWCGIQRLRGTADFELIYALKATRWGNGFATEAASALVAGVAALKAPRINQIWGIVFPQNLKSIRVLEKLGMTFSEHRFDKSTQSFASAYVLRRNAFVTALSLSDRYSSIKK